MRYRVSIEPEAEAEIEQAFLFMQTTYPDLAVAWFNGLQDVLETLALHPRRCPRAPEDRFFKEEIRQLVYGRRRGAYRILFTISGDEVRILHVRHASRENLSP